MTRRTLTTLILALMCTISSGAVLYAKQALPLAVGNLWEYSVTQVGILSFGEPGSSQSIGLETEGKSIDEVLGIREQLPNGDVVFEYRSTTRLEPGFNVDSKESIEDTYMRVGKEGIKVLSMKSTDDGVSDSGWINYNPPLTMLIADLKPGKRWEIGTVRYGDLSMPQVGQVAGIESVRVPAGYFENCIKIHVTCHIVEGYIGSGAERAQIENGRSVSTVWMAPGVGVVREDTIVQVRMLFTSEGHDVKLTGTHRETRELLPGYQVH